MSVGPLAIRRHRRDDRSKQDALGCKTGGVRRPTRKIDLRKYGVIHWSVWNDVAIAHVGAGWACLLILDLQSGELVELEIEHRLLRINPVKLRVITTEDRGLYWAVSRAERRKAVLLLHVFGDFDPAQAFDLPLRRAGP